MNDSFSLRRSAYTLMMAIVLMAGLNIVIDIWLSSKAEALDNESDRINLLQFKAHQLSFDVVQVQQFITDSSATGESDGVGSAEKFASEAGLEIDALVSGGALTSTNADDLRTRLATFVSVGKEMVAAYAVSREAGNAIMKRPQTGFDARSDEMQSAVDVVLVFLDKKNEAISRKVENNIIRQRNILIAVNLTLAIAVFLLMMMIGRKVTRYLGSEPATLRDAADRCARGDFSKALVVSSQTDKGSVYARMSEMQNALMTAAKAANENLRVKIALDTAGTNVMMADNDRNIIYVNRSIVAMLKNAESDIRKSLPNFNSDKLLGTNIDQFHKHPEYQQQLLATFTTSHQGEIMIGGRTFDLSANPVINEKGERLGSVVEWVDRTDAVAADKMVEDEFTAIANGAALGDFSQRIDTNNKQGVMQRLASNINNMLEVVQSSLDDMSRVLGALAKGDLTERIDADYQGQLGQLKDDANATSEQLSGIIGSIQDAVDAISTAAREIAAGNSDLSARTENQAASLEETASSMEELTATVRQNSDNARQANQFARTATEVAVKGGDVMTNMVATMEAINTSSKKIVDIISVIDGIAFQTNILALNAAVEAARAGEQGRGFAVVASEVRSLAQRSATAAKEIKELIGDSVEKVANGSRLVDQAGATMAEVVSSVKRVTELMGEIAAASQEQSSGIEQVNQTITQMDEMTQQNAAMVEEASAAAHSMEEQANTLAQAVDIFRLEGRDNVVASPMAIAKPVTTRAASSATTRGKSLAAPTIRKPKIAGKSAASDQDWNEF